MHLSFIKIAAIQQKKSNADSELKYEYFDIQ